MISDASTRSICRVSRSDHAFKRWRRPSGYAFASRMPLVPLGFAEVSAAALALSLAFVVRRDGWTLFAVLGLSLEENLYVDERHTWLASYIPARLRAHPFRMGHANDGRGVLCVDEGTGFVVNGWEGEAFFDDKGEMSSALKGVWAFLKHMTADEFALSKVCNTLHSAGVLEPWPIPFPARQGVKRISGLHRVNQAALSALSGDILQNLFDTGALRIAYAQLLSMDNVSGLAKLDQARTPKTSDCPNISRDRPFLVLPDDSTIDWDWSKVGRP